MNYRQRRQHRLAMGLHPAHGLPLAGNGKTCGDCRHHAVRRFGKTYHKCDLMTQTAGPGSDIRVSWPACEKFEEETPCSINPPKT